MGVRPPEAVLRRLLNRVVASRLVSSAEHSGLNCRRPSSGLCPPGLSNRHLAERSPLGLVMLQDLIYTYIVGKKGSNSTLRGKPTHRCASVQQDNKGQ
jgi:hypothetical protein